MDITTIFSAFDGISIVAWFALLVVVFAVFVGLGIYQGLRDQVLQRKSPEAPAVARRRAHPPTHSHKEYT